MTEMAINAMLAEIGRKLDPEQEDFSGDVAIVTQQENGTWLFKAGWGMHKVTRTYPTLEDTPEAGLKIIL